MIQHLVDKQWVALALLPVLPMELSLSRMHC